MKFLTQILLLSVAAIGVVLYFLLKKEEKEDFMYGATKNDLVKKFYPEFKEKVVRDVVNKLDRGNNNPDYQAWQDQTETSAERVGISYEEQVAREAQWVWEKRHVNLLHQDYDTMAKIWVSNAHREFYRNKPTTDGDEARRRVDEYLENKERILNELFYKI